MSKIIILSGSVRKGGNTELLVQACRAGMAQNHTVEIISLADVEVHPCTGCNACFTSEGNRCCYRDDMAGIYEQLETADVLVVATPVYFYGVSAQLKALIDRLHNPIRKRFRLKKLALLAVGADTLPALFDAIVMQYQLVLQYFQLENAGMVLIGGAEERGALAGNREALEQARALGRSID